MHGHLSFKVGTAESTKDEEFEELYELFSKNELVVQKVAQVHSCIPNVCPLHLSANLTSSRI